MLCTHVNVLSLAIELIILLSLWIHVNVRSIDPFIYIAIRKVRLFLQKEGRKVVRS